MSGRGPSLDPHPTEEHGPLQPVPLEWHRRPSHEDSSVRIVEHRPHETLSTVRVLDHSQ